MELNLVVKVRHSPALPSLPHDNDARSEMSMVTPLRRSLPGSAEALASGRPPQMSPPGPWVGRYARLCHARRPGNASGTKCHAVHVASPTDRSHSVDLKIQPWPFSCSRPKVSHHRDQAEPIGAVAHPTYITVSSTTLVSARSPPKLGSLLVPAQEPRGLVIKSDPPGGWWPTSRARACGVHSAEET